MKKNNGCVLFLLIFLTFPMLIGYISSGWFILTVIQTEFSEEQTGEICEQFNIKLAPAETIRTEYDPGYYFGTRSLTVYVENIVSTDDFLSRFLDGAGNDIERMDEYYTERFQLTQKPKNYHCGFAFTEEEGNTAAGITITGAVPNLDAIYGFLYDPWKPAFANWMFLGCLILEICLIIYLLIQKVMARRRKNTVKDVAK